MYLTTLYKGISGYAILSSQVYLQMYHVSGVPPLPIYN